MHSRYQYVSLALLLVLFVSGCAKLIPWSGNSDLPLEQELTEKMKEEIDIQFGLTRIVERKGQLEEAEKSYLEILQVAPDYYQAIHRLGVIAASRENLDVAIEHLERAAEIEDTAELLGDLGYTCLLNCQIDKAEEYLYRAFDLSPDDSRITNNLALVLGYKGNFNESLRLFRRCNPESQALTNIGYIHSQLGDFPEARRYFHAALDIDPTVEQAAGGLVELQKLAQAENGEQAQPEAHAHPALEASVADGVTQ